MPELPEVETVVRELRSCLNGRQILDWLSDFPKTFEPDLTTIRRVSRGKTIREVRRRGKYILLSLGEKSCISIHLRMTGKCIFAPTERDINHTRAILDLKGLRLYYVDPRRFGRIHYWPDYAELDAKLGPDATDPHQVLQALLSCHSHRAIKSLLLDQSVLAGLGNIYADEACFAAGLHPETPRDQIPNDQLKILARKIPGILNKSIRHMGTTLSDYRTTQNIGGQNRQFLKVYGQLGKACSTCSTPIEKKVLAGRSSHFCPSCQPLQIATIL